MGNFFCSKKNANDSGGDEKCVKNKYPEVDPNQKITPAFPLSQK